jgi:putative ABC transport system permease protein
VVAAHLRYACRLLRRNPGFTATAVLALALGIGANTAIFSVVNAVLLQPLPYPDPGRMVQLRGSTPGGDYNPTSVPRFMAYRALTGTFQDVTAYDWNGGSGVNLGVAGSLEQVRGEHVSEAYFRLFGARFILGRPFSTDEDRPGGGRVTVLSGGLWQRRFGGDPNIAGKTILLGGEPYTVLGVTSPAFTPAPEADLWLPLQADPNTTSHSFIIYCAARLRQDVSLAKARAALRAAADKFRRKYPASIGPKSTFTAQPLIENVTGDVRPALLVLLAAVGCLLLIACANVANLLLARALGRGREIAIRAAIGATRRQIAVQLITESLLLAGLGGICGLLLGAAALPVFLEINPGNLPRLNAGAVVLLDPRVLAFSLAITVLTGILFGLAPALHLSRADLITPIRNRRHRARGAIVIAEVAVALVLLVGAGLFLRTFNALRHVPAGFDGRNVLTMETALAGTRFETTAAVTAMVRETERRIRAIPGVLSVAVAPSVPLESSIGVTFNVDGRPPGAELYHGGASWRTVTPGYFDVFRIPILRGRGLTERDNSATGPVAVISQSMARSQWPHEDPIGRTISIYGGGDEVNTLHCRVVGIAGDVHQDGLHAEAGSVIYFPLAQLSDAQVVLQWKIVPLSWALRTSGAPLRFATAVQREIAREGLPAAHVRAMEHVSVASLARDRFNALLMSIFALTAILLAGIGLYGVLSFAVQQRTQEFGIRLALGADSLQLRNLVIGEALTLAGIGIGIGLAAAWGLTRLMTTVLFGVQPRDPLVFATVPVLLAGMALLASALPARRAVRLEPMEALRRE